MTGLNKVNLSPFYLLYTKQCVKCWGHKQEIIQWYSKKCIKLSFLFLLKQQSTILLWGQKGVIIFHTLLTLIDKELQEMNSHFTPKALKKKKSFMIRKVLGVWKKPVCVCVHICVYITSRKINFEMKCSKITSPNGNYC